MSMLSRIHRRPLAMALAFAVASAAAPAAASTISLSGTTLIVEGTNGDDVIVGYTSGPDLFLLGLTWDVVTPVCDATTLRCSLADFDVLAVLGLAGDDFIVMNDVESVLNLFLSGGDGADVIIGGDGDDILKGGAGDDILFGGPGANVGFGGSGDNILVDVAPGTGPEPPDPAAVPEPGAMTLTGLGLAASLTARQRRSARLRDSIVLQKESK
jgi:Ca2+-binding RTX toxin-like protein